MNRLAKMMKFFTSGFFLTLLLISSVYAEEAEPAKTVRVGWYQTAGLQDVNEPSTLSGYNYEYLAKISQYENWDYEFVFGTWSDLEQQLIHGEIDLMGDVAVTEERKALYNFCDYPNGYSRMLMVARSDDDRFAYNDYGSFNGITVGTLPSSFRKALLDREAKEHHYSVTYKEYQTNEEMFTALKNGETDTAIFSNVNSYQDFKVISEWEPNPFYFIVTKSRDDILSELNDAMQRIQSTDLFIQERLFNKYFGDNGKNSVVGLTRDELTYVRQSGPISVLISKNQKPISYVKDGKAMGMIPDYMDLISKKTGLKFSYVICDHFKDMGARFQNGDSIIFAQFPDNFNIAEEQNTNLTTPFYTLLYGFINYPDNALKKKKLIAIEEGKISLSAMLEKEGYQTITFPDESRCLDAVVDHKADAAALSSISYDQLSYHAKYSGLSFQPKPDLDINISLGISKSSGKTLYSIIEKAANAISSTTMSGIVVSNTNIVPEYTLQDIFYRYQPAVFIIILLLSVIGILFAWFHRKNQLYSKLQATKLEAEQANDAKSSFLSSMSHDIRTPLNGIIGFTEVALNENDPEKKQTYLKKIKSSGELLLDLVNDILDLSRIESGKLVLEQEAVDSHQVIEKVVTALQPSAEMKGITLKADLSAYPDEMIWVDRLKFQKIILNLLSNAIKYTPKGGTVTLSVQKIDPPQNGLTRRILIKDNGIGMSPEFMSRLYQPFSQEHRPEAKNITGTGLGLSIVKRFVEFVGGKIDVQSQLGKGTQFTVELPIQLADAQKISENSQTDQHKVLSGKRILICEDNAMNSEIAQLLLKEKGMITDCSQNGKEGLSQFAASPEGYYAAILMDIRMPVMDGFEATQAIRALPRSDSKTVPIIAMSAEAFTEDILAAEQSGMNGYITKPFEPEKLFNELSRNIK